MNQKMFGLLAVMLLSGCGGGSGDASTDSTKTDSSNTGSNLSSKYPVSENSTLPASLNQSFYCIDDNAGYGYEVTASSNGNLTAIDTVNGSGGTLDSGTYTLNGSTLAVSMNTYYQGYSNSYHKTAGDLLLGFSGTDQSSVTLYCAAFKHNFAEKVSQKVTIQCDSIDKSTLNPSAHDWHEDVFELNTDGSARHGYTYKGNITTAGSQIISYGTHVYDASTGEFSVSFADVGQTSVSLYEFEGQVANGQANVEVNRVNGSEDTFSCQIL